MDIDAVYAAGFFDGEGYVDIYNYYSSGKSKSPSFILRVIVTQKDGQIMNWLKDRYGGSVMLRPNRGKHYIYNWTAHSRVAEKFLKTIQPFAKLKRPQIDLALEFVSRKKNHGWFDSKSRKFTGLTEEELEIRFNMQKKLKEMKKVYILYQESGTGTTTE